jgi:hypothetical protein
MISFKSFIHAIHDAILQANSTLIDKNQEVLDQYFEETTVPVKTDDGEAPQEKTVLRPKTTILEYPHLDSDGNPVMTEISVPLITLSPLNLSQIEKVSLTSEFEMQINQEKQEVEIDFFNKGGIFSGNKNTKTGKIEIVITPQDTSEGLKILVEAYENILKRQL